MAILIGSDSTTGFTNDASFDAADGYYFRSFTASSSGTISTLGLYHRNWLTSSALKLCIWNSSGTLLGSTAATSTLSGGFVVGSVSVAVEASTSYLMGFIVNSNNWGGYVNGTTWTLGKDGSSANYASPGNLSSPTTGDLAVGQFQMYGDGTAGGSAAPLAAFYNMLRRNN